MPITEAARSDLYTGLVEVLGAERAETLMSAFPMYELDEVATKRDLAELRVEFVREFAGVRAEIAGEVSSLRDDLNTRFLQLTLVLVVGLLGVIATLIGVTALG
jgi:hypothetical protein